MVYMKQLPANIAGITRKNPESYAVAKKQQKNCKIACGNIQKVIDKYSSFMYNNSCVTQGDGKTAYWQRTSSD